MKNQAYYLLKAKKGLRYCEKMQDILSGRPACNGCSECEKKQWYDSA